MGSATPRRKSGRTCSPARAASDRITQFDASNYACQIAAEVKNFDPLNFVEKKKLRRWAASSTSPSRRRMKR